MQGTSIISTIIVGAIILAIVAVVVYSMVRRSKSGKGGCCGCEHAENCGHSTVKDDSKS